MSLYENAHLSFLFWIPLFIVGQPAYPWFNTFASDCAAWLPAMPLIYPSAIVGSYGFNLETELFFLTLTFLHLGLLRTCQRYAQLRQSLESDEVCWFEKIYI